MNEFKRKLPYPIFEAILPDTGDTEVTVASESSEKLSIDDLRVKLYTTYPSVLVYASTKVTANNNIISPPGWVAVKFKRKRKMRKQPQYYISTVYDPLLKIKDPKRKQRLL